MVQLHDGTHLLMGHKCAALLVGQLMQYHDSEHPDSVSDILAIITDSH